MRRFPVRNAVMFLRNRCRRAAEKSRFHTAVCRLSLRKDMETRPHTDGFRRNNAKCLKSNGICSFVPYSSIGGF